MTNSPSKDPAWNREVLFSHSLLRSRPRWLGEVEDGLRPSGFVVCRTHSGPDTIRRVEQGGLGAAVLIADGAQIDGLSILRIIRSIDAELPCWLVTTDTTRQLLEAALSLHVTSVMTQPVEVNRLTLALKRVLINPARRN